MTTLYDMFTVAYEILCIGCSPLVETYPLMQTPTPVFLILMAYLSFVLVIGPLIMKNRPPFELKKTMIVYNSLQVLFSMFIVYKSMIINLPYLDIFSASCGEKYEKGSKTYVMVTISAWWYMVAKITELLDTIFFVLRKQTRQITFLHVFHHSTILLVTWIGLKYTMGEQAGFIVLINSTVHVIMYFYYMVAAMGPQYKKYLWWKKYITTMQMIQFCLIIFYMLSLTFSNCGYDNKVSYFSATSGGIFLSLFANFFIKTYNKDIKKADNVKKDS